MSKDYEFRSARDVFVAFLRAITPYTSDVVIIGGWVHALYLADGLAQGAPGGEAILTDDIDIAVRCTLLLHGSPRLVDLVTAIGFERDPLSDLKGAAIRLTHTVGAALIDLDIMTESINPRTAMAVEGQSGLYVAGYPGQAILMENTLWMSVGIELRDSLDPPTQIRVSC